MKMIVKVDNEITLIKAVSSHIEKMSNDAIDSRGKFFIGLSGGSVITYLSDALSSMTTDFTKWTLAFCDERVVPEDSEDSTFGMYKKQLMPMGYLKEEQFIKIKQGASAAETAKDYTTKLSKAFNSDNFVFDVLLLGMGPDGHTCSLFPDHKLLDEKVYKVAAITDSPKPPPQRITLTFPVINAARNCIFAVSGEGKADIIKRILKDKEDLPANKVNPEGCLYWILDNAAAVHL